MSGGTFDYLNFQIDQLANEIEMYIEKHKNKTNGEWNPNFSEEIWQKFSETVAILKISGKMSYLVDYLCSGDLGEESFSRRWNEEVIPLKEKLCTITKK